MKSLILGKKKTKKKKAPLLKMQDIFLNFKKNK